MAAQDLVLCIDDSDNKIYWGELRSQHVGVNPFESREELFDDLPNWPGAEVRYFLPGDAQHASLITELKRRQQVVLIGSPAALRHRGKSRGAAIRQLFNLSSLPPGMGGWRPLTELDAKVLEFLGAYFRSGVCSETERLFREHPAYVPATFAGPNHEAQLRLVAFMEDPRWFINPADPDSNQRLFQFFGLTEVNAKYVVQLGRKGGFRLSYAQTVLLAAGWREDGTADQEWETPFTRLCAQKVTIGVPLWQAILFALEQYLCLIRQWWLKETSVPRRDELFALDHTFAAFGFEQEQAANLFRNFSRPAKPRKG